MGKYLTRLEAAFILRVITISKPGLVIDVGAEAGRFSLLADKSKASVVGIDVDKYSLRRLKQKNPGVPVVQADARKLPFKNEAFDSALMVEVVDYIPQLCDALSECHRIQKVNSPLVFSFGNQSSLKAKLRSFRGKAYAHSYREVKQCLAKVGFKVDAQMGYNWLPFGRMSQSRLVPFFAGAEKALALRRLPKFSPWVMVKATKSA